MTNRFKFTKTTIEALPAAAAQKRVTHYDTLLPKLALRVTDKGVKTFTVIKRKGRGMVWFKLGVFPDLTVERAREAAETTLGAFAKQEDPAAVRRAARIEPNLNALFKEYGDRHGSKKRSWVSDKQRYRDYLAKPLGSHKISTITREQIGRILSDMERNGKANGTINAVRALASGIFNKAIEWSYLTANPIVGIKTRKTTKRDRFLQADELPRFFAAVMDEPNDTIRDYILLSLFTGARRANVLSMRWKDVSLDESIWRITRTKNDEPQNVTLSPEALRILKERDKAADSDAAYVFPGTGKHGHLVEPKRGWTRVLDRDELTQLMQRLEAAGKTLVSATKVIKGEEAPESLDEQLVRARKQAKQCKVNVDGTRIPDLRLHDLRRTLGSWQAKTGASLTIIGKALNHKSQQATAIYARLDLDPVRQSVNVATVAIMKAAGTRRGTCA